MRLLFIAPRLPWPTDTGGKIRTFNILKQLTAFSRVDLVCFSFEGDDEVQAGKLQGILPVDVYRVPQQDPSFSGRLKQLTAPLPLSVVKYASDAMAAKIKSLTQARNYDAVHIDHIHMAQYRQVIGGIPYYIDEHNVEFKILERCGRVEKNLMKKIIYFHQSAKMRSYERDAVSNCPACGAVSSEDAGILKALTGNGNNIHVVPNGVDTEYFTTQDTGQSDPKGSLPSRDTSHEFPEKAVVFTGSMDWLPNADAALFMAKDILPVLWRGKPEVKFYIVGKNPSPEIRRLGQADGRIIITGSVDDVRGFMDRAAVFVCPLRIGGGTRLKILEAMSMEKAVVSTSIGAEGLACRDQVDIVIADHPQDFADQTAALLDDPDRCRALGANGRRLVAAEYDWDVIGKKFNRIYGSLAKI